MKIDHLEKTGTRYDGEVKFRSAAPDYQSAVTRFYGQVTDVARGRWLRASAKQLLCIPHAQKYRTRSYFRPEEEVYYCHPQEVSK
jgi:hypothetical protein